MGLFSFGKNKKLKKEESPKMFKGIKEKDLNEGDLRFIQVSLENADKIINVLYQGGNSEKYHPEILDEVFKLCLDEIEAKTLKPAQVREALGVAYGTYLNSDMGSDWLVYTDNHGTDLAIKFPKGGFAFPLSTVEKRIESKEVNFFGAIHTVFKKEN